MAKKIPDPIDVFVGARIREARLLRALSQEKLGDKLGLTFQQVQKYEKGTNRVGASRLHQIGTVLGIAAGDFFPPQGEAAPLVVATEGSAQTRGELELLRDFRKASPKLQQMLLSAAHQTASACAGDELERGPDGFVEQIAA